jgi:type I restriction enzyme M protein
MLGGVVSMPSNIFATTGTNVSILFLDATNKGDVILIDASNLGEKVKEGKNQKTLLSPEEEKQIIEVFNTKKAIEDFSIVVSYDDIEAKNYSLSAGQYFDVKVDHTELSQQEFDQRIQGYQARLSALFAGSRVFEKEIETQLKMLSYEE